MRRSAPRPPGPRLSRCPAPDHGTCCIPPYGRARSAPGATWSVMSNGLRSGDAFRMLRRSAPSLSHPRAIVAAGADLCRPR